MTRMITTGILLGTIAVAGVAVALDQRASQPSQRPGQLREDARQQLQLRPEVLLQEINALKIKVTSLQQQVTSLQADLTAASSQNQRLATLESALKVDAAGNVTIEAPGKITLSTNVLKATASTLTVYAPLTGFHGTLKADTVITNSTVSASYSPGAGNIW